MIINFLRPHEIPYTKQVVFLAENKEDIGVKETLIDTGAAYNIIDTELWRETNAPIVTKRRMILEGISGSIETGITAIRTKIDEVHLGYVCYCIVDLSSKRYKAILGMSFLKNFKLIFDFDDLTDYQGTLELIPKYNPKNLIFDIQKVVYNAGTFGIYTSQK